MNVKCLQVFLLAGCLSLHTSAIAQYGSNRNQPDHPSHRYLPPPVGAGSLSEQIHSLERLRQSSQQDESAPLELSPAQLKQLDSLLESFRGEDGQLNIPSPDSVPKQWIESLLPDPKQRQQAKEMLEQYSRTRNLPLPSKNSPNTFPPIDGNESPFRSESPFKSQADGPRPGAPRPKDMQPSIPQTQGLRDRNPQPDDRNQARPAEGTDQGQRGNDSRPGRSPKDSNLSDGPRNTQDDNPFNTPRDDAFKSPGDDPFNIPGDDPFKSPADNPFKDPYGDPLGREGQPGNSHDGPSSAAPSKNNSSSNNKASNNNDPFSNEPFNNRASSGDNPPGSFELPKDTPQALRDLYETLKRFQQQNTQEQRESTSSRLERRASQAQRERSGNAPSRNEPRNDPRASRPYSPNAPAQSSKAETKGSSQWPGNSRQGSTQRPSTSPNSLPPGRTRAQPQLTDNDAQLGTGGTGGPGSSPGSDGSAPGRPSPDGVPGNALPGSTQPAETSESAPRIANPFEKDFDFSAQPQMPANPFSETEDPTANHSGRGASSKKSGTPASPPEPFNVMRMAEQLQQPQHSRPGPGGRGSSPNGSNGTDPSGPTDWKKSVNDYGLAPALKRIVEKTLKEQGFDPKQQTASSQPGNNQPGNNQPGSRVTPPNLGLPGTMPPQATEQLKKWANSVATTPGNSPGNTPNNSPSSSNSNWGRWVAETWKSVAQSPSSRPSPSASRSTSSSWSSPAASASSSGGLPDMRWSSSMSIAVIVVAALILLIVWFSRQRVAELSDTSAAQAEWVRTVISQGLKTRADVIRAFHQLVKQSRAVSDWWTHRSIVKHFSTHTPQLAPAISELAVVYEQARYYPDDVELSPQQLAQVRALLESVKIPAANRV